MIKGISGGEGFVFGGGDGVEDCLAAEFHKDKGFGWGKLGKNQRVTGKKLLNKHTWLMNGMRQGPRVPMGKGPRDEMENWGWGGVFMMRFRFGGTGMKGVA